MTGTKLIRRQIDRPNVYLARRRISNQSSFDDLNFIIPNYACDIRLIPKTMIFVDSRPMVCALTDYLLNRLALAWVRSAAERPPPEDVVADYSTILSNERRLHVLDKFREGSCRVIACTDAAGMGIDIRDVQRVIQWKATSILSLTSYFQRAGRAGRDPSCHSVAIMFHQSSLGELENEYALYKEDIQGACGNEILKAIKAFDGGTDEGAAVRRGKRTMKNILQNRGLECDHTKSTNSEESSTDPRSADPRKLICRGLLSQIGTTGCMRSSILRYFDFWKSDVPPERCCDSCVERGELELPSNIYSLLPEHIIDTHPDDEDEPDDDDEPDDEEDEDCEDEATTQTVPTHSQQSLPTLSMMPLSTSRPRIPALTPAQIHIFQDALGSLRTKIWSSQFQNFIRNKLSPFRDTLFFTEPEIFRLSVNGHKIQQVDNIAKYLNVNKNFQWTTIAPYIADVLKCIQDAYSALNIPSIPPPTRGRKPQTSD